MQTFLQKIAHARKEKQLLLPKDEEIPFVKLLLNRNVTEFDMDIFNYKYMSFDQEYLYHLKDNCPSIQRIRFVCDEEKEEEWMDFPSSLEMKKSWPNLTHLSLRGVTFTNEELKKLQRYIPQLEWVRLLNNF